MHHGIILEKTLYGSEWIETINVLIPSELCHDSHVSQFKRSFFNLRKSQFVGKTPKKLSL